MQTTNGIERQNRHFKDFLRQYNPGKLLVNMVDVLVNKFLPDSRNRYLKYNVESMQEYKQYSTQLPTFLVNRPKKFVEHCMSRISQGEINVWQTDSDCFTAQNSDSNTSYTVQVGDEMPMCGCLD